MQDLLPWEKACIYVSEIRKILYELQMPETQREDLLEALEELSEYFECPNN